MIKTDFNRRHFLQLAAAGFLGVTSNDLFSAPGGASSLPLRANPAKQMIYLFMAGGMSHLDTFDLKPGHDNQGSTSPINTKVDGMRF